MLTFYTSLTVAPSDIVKISQLLETVGRLEEGLSHILTTPLFINQRALGLIRDLKERIGAQVCFDSAGYYVQVGRISYDDLYYRLLCLYRAQPWADRFVLPDHVPLSREHPDPSTARRIVWDKVRQTVDMSCIFWQEMPAELKRRCVPVVHGHTAEQIEYCLSHYLQLDSMAALGFGSFATGGKDNEANMTTEAALENVRLVVEVAQRHGLDVHLFGLGVPATVGLIRALNVSSFDSASWLKAAGFGQVNLPFTRSYNITHRSTRSELQRGITREEFDRLRAITDHTCPFCANLDDLADKKMYRAVHNLLALRESVAAVNAGEDDRIAAIYAQSSPKYRKAFLQWQARQDRERA